VLGVQFPQAVDDAKVTITDSSGNVVQTIDLGAQAAGSQPVLWDGSEANGSTAPDGNYTFTVQATAGGQSVAVNPLQYGVVVSVSAGSGSVAVNATGLGTVNYSNIGQIL
jgi:flagellar basal-body rod modification protein FlgD